MSLETRLNIHEDVKLKPYFDCCGKFFRLCTCEKEGKKQGKLTLGVGRNIEDKGISESEAFAMRDADIAEARADGDTFPWFEHLNSVRQDVVTEMIFNIGIEKFHEFKMTIAAISRGDFHTASAEMMNSVWAKEVGNRAMELSKMMWSGEEL